MEERGGRLLPRQLLLLLLLVPYTLQQQDSRQDTRCPCRRERPQEMQVPFPDDSFMATKGGMINCCVEWILGYSDPAATVTWTFKGQTYPWQKANTFQEFKCGLETLETFSTLPSDEGNYTCTITASNGTSVTNTMRLSIAPNPDFRQEPKPSTMSGDTLATVGANASFICEAFVGRHAPGRLTPRVTWTKLFLNGTIDTFVKKLPGVKLSEIHGERGMLTGHLTIDDVKKIHFGTYSCVITSSYGSLIRNVSLTEGVSKRELEMQQYKTAVVAAVTVVALIAVVLWVVCRLRFVLALYCRHTGAAATLRDGFQYDVLVVHGESASQWVWSVLLPMLEDTCGYTCFLPERDMCGGDHVADSILSAISKCRRVVVVVTPCLLTSPWATWATYSGIHAALTTPARILALLLKESRGAVASTSNNTMLGILKVVKKVRVPAVCGWQVAEGPEEQMDAGCIRLETKTTNHTELTIPEIKVETAWSNSPKSQRLSNMITGSNNASREDLEADKDKPETRDPVIYTEEYGMQDPGSPCSITPFILPSCRRDVHHATMCQSVCSCMRLVCVGDPEQLFWQKVRLRLGPPALRSLENKA